MNEDRAITLYDAITEVREAYIEEAARPCRNVRRRASWAAIAACLFFIVGGWTFLRPFFQPLGFAIANPFLRPGSSSGGIGGLALAEYHFYAGPVLPLTAEAEGLTAERRVEYDFSLFNAGLAENGEYASLQYKQSCLVTDTYRLSAPESGTYTLYYPYVASLTDAAALLPRVTVNGAAAETELLVGPGSTGVFSWEDLVSLMGEDCLDRALAGRSIPETKMTVYALSDLRGEKSEDVPSPTVVLEYTADRVKSAVTTYGFNGGSDDLQNGGGSRLVGVRADNLGKTAYLLVLGEDLTDWTLRGYADGTCETPCDSVGATVTRYESTLGEMLALLWQEYRQPYLSDKQKSLLSGETVVGLTFRLLLDRSENLTAAVRTLNFGLEDQFDQVLSQKRVLYLRFTAEIPASEAAEVEVKLVKYPSTDFGGPERQRQGFDLAGKLGSNITFTGLEANVTGTEYVTFLRQDFGFEPEKGVLEVPLDPAGEHWYMDVTARGK